MIVLGGRGAPGVLMLYRSEDKAVIYTSFTLPGWLWRWWYRVLRTVTP
jgi:hypothetical protein